MAEDSLRTDPAWKYSRLQNAEDVNTMVCSFCSKVTKGGVYRMKQHLIGGFRNATSCRKCPDHVKEELQAYMSKKKEIKSQRNLIPDIDDVENYGDDDEDEDEPITHSSKRSTSSLESMKSSSKKPKQKGPMDSYFTPNPETVVQNRTNDKGKGKQTTLNAVYKKEMRENTIQRIARWFYDTGIPLNACNYPSFAPMIEATGQFGHGLKPPTNDELRVSCLKKRIRKQT